MTLLKAPWAVDGPLIPSSLARIGSYIASGGAEGIVSLGDLKVAELSTPGAGIQIGSGAAVMLNRYQNPKPQQSYAIENVNAHVVDSDDMPPSNPSAKSYLVVIVVGDPEFTTVGHPFMGEYEPGVTDDDEFDFVRVRFVECPSSTRHFKSLGLNYPGYAPARIDIPANTTTITNDMIVDLREMAQPRTKEFLEHLMSGADDQLGYFPNDPEQFPNGVAFNVDIPEWAVRAKCSGFVEGLRLHQNGTGTLRIGFNDHSAHTQSTNINENNYIGGNYDRRTYNLGGEFHIPAAIRGTTKRIEVQGSSGPAAAGFLRTDGYSSGQIRILFEEAPD